MPDQDAHAWGSPSWRHMWSWIQLILRTHCQWPCQPAPAQQASPPAPGNVRNAEKSIPLRACHTAFFQITKKLVRCWTLQMCTLSHMLVLHFHFHGPHSLSHLKCILILLSMNVPPRAAYSPMQWTWEGGICWEDSHHIKFKHKKILLFKTYHLHESALRYPVRESGKRRNSGLGEGPGERDRKKEDFYFSFLPICST